MSDTIAAGHLRAFIERILRLKEEQDTIAADIRDIYAEAKGSGFDKTAMGQLVSHVRKVDKIGMSAVEEKQTIFDMYLDAYQRGTGTKPALAHTHENSAGMVSRRTETAPDRTGANTENDHVDGGAPARTPAGEDFVALTGQIEPRNRAENSVDGNASLAAREGEQAAAPIPEPFEPPVFLQKERKPLRPLCLNPTECAGYGTHTCHGCLKAAGHAEVAA